MKFAVVYRQAGCFHDTALWFKTAEEARARARKVLADQEAKTVAIVEVFERAHNEVVWVR